jgi:hypothetical protein
VERGGGPAGFRTSPIGRQAYQKGSKQLESWGLLARLRGRERSSCSCRDVGAPPVLTAFECSFQGRNSSIAPITAGFDFHFSSQVHRAAVLVLKPWADLYHALQHERIQNYCMKFGEGWYEFAKSQGFAVACGEIILVYGVVRTATWALAAFTENDTRVGAGVSLDAASFSGAGARLYRAWDERSSVENRSGPPVEPSSFRGRSCHGSCGFESAWSFPSPLLTASGSSLQDPSVHSPSINPVSKGLWSYILQINSLDIQGDLPASPTAEGDWKFDQTIFLRHYVIKPRRLRAPKVMRGAADPQDLMPYPFDEDIGASLPVSEDDSSPIPSSPEVTVVPDRQPVGIPSLSSVVSRS